jgi:hypothetical protein
MPMRVPIPGTSLLPEDEIPTEASQDDSNTFALRAFFYDFCFQSANTNLSRGYLSGLEMMTFRLGFGSNLVKACEALSFASHGKTLQRPSLVHKAELFNQELLGSFARDIENPSTAVATWSRLVAMLLGLYQVVIPDSSLV